MSVDCDVIVVGAGPIGLTTSLLLRQLGHSVQLVERHAKRYPQPRAVGLFHQAVRAFGALGLLEQMMESGALQNIRGVVNDNASYVNGDGEVLAQYQMNGPLSKSGTALAYAIHQPSIEEELEKACVQRGVQVHRSAEVTNVVEAGDRVQIAFKNSDNDPDAAATAKKATAKFVVGCDGAHSIVRKSAGINFIQFEPPRSRWLVVDIIPKPEHTSYQWKDAFHPKQYLDPIRPRTSVPSPSTRRRWEFMVMPDESTELATSDEFIWKMLALFDCTPVTAIIERKTVYSIGGGWVDAFAKGRVALAGDSSHLSPQFLGQGLNSGLRDAKSLAWRLDFGLKHPDSNWAALLKDYSDEQLHTTKRFVTAAKGIEKLLTITDPEQAKARDKQIQDAAIEIPDLERVGPGMHLRDGNIKYNPICEPGTLFIQDKIEINGKTGFFDNMIGDGWVLISKAKPILSPQVQESFTKLFAGQVVHFTGEGSYKDVSGRYLDWFAKSDQESVLVRPDFYIYGTAKTVKDVDGLLGSALERVA